MQQKLHISLMLLAGAGVISPALAQQPIANISPENSKESSAVKESKSQKDLDSKLGSFEAFKAQVEDEFQDFHSKVVENYAAFLDGEWIPFEPCQPKAKYTEPKPTVAPVTENGTNSAAESKNTPGIFAVIEEVGGDSAEKFPLLQATAENESKERMGAFSDELLSQFTKSADTQRIIKDAKYKYMHPDDDTPGDWFKFYDMDVRIPLYDYQIMNSMQPYNIDDHRRFSTEVAAQWRLLDDDKVGEIVGKSLDRLARDMNLNDYLRYELARQYVNTKFPNASMAARTALVHYLMVHQGYDVRLSASIDGITFLLIPTTQKMYGLYSLGIGKGDNTYYMFSVDDDTRFADRRYTGQCFMAAIPENLPHGKNFDFRINNLRIPEVPVPYSVEFGGLKLEGEVNAMLMPIVKHYPQMETEGFAESVLDEKFHNDLVRQVKSQLANMDPVDATQQLLWFTQKGFAYQTDDELHGYEKPYFIEENFFYPANDCEDRSIFFTYLMWNALGVESQLVAYPGHEAASVQLPQCINNAAYYYNYSSIPFVIADPTYIGAGIGDAMGFYQNIAPDRIDLYYNPVFEARRAAEAAARAAEAQREQGLRL